MASTRPRPRRVTTEKLLVGICAEDRPLRDRVCAALVAAGHDIFAQEATADELLASCNGSAPACVVVVSDRPDRPAVGLVKLIRSKLGDVSAVLVCRQARGTEVRRALELGVDGVVLQGETEKALPAVVAAVCAGQVSVPRGQRGEVRAQALTTRERQVLALVVAGLTNTQIANKLFLAESTVKSHLSSAFAKLGVSSRNEATTMILDPERGHGLGIRRVIPGGDPVAGPRQPDRVGEPRPVRR